MFNIESLDDTPVIDGCTSFRGGVYSDAPAKNIGADQASLMVNIDLEANGVATTRRGCLRLGADYVEDGGASAGGRWIQGLHSYNRPTVNYIMAVNNRALWRYSGGTWTHVTGYGAGALPAHTQIHVSMAQGNDKLYLSDIFKNIFQYDGAVFTDLGSGGATQPPFGCGSIVWHTERLVAGASSTSPDTIAFSDILDATTWDTATQNIVVGKGDGQPVTGLFSWVDYNLLVFKRRGIWIVNANPAQAVADFTIKPISHTLGVAAWRTAAQVGNDVFVLTDDGVRSIRRTIASETQQDIGEPISAPVDDILRRINPSLMPQSHAVAWEHRYILFVALDASTYPNYALVYNTLAQSWSGYWTGWNALVAAPYVATDGSPHLAFGDAFGRVKEFLDYSTTEAIGTFRDDGVEIASQIDTRALTFGDPLSPKTGFNYELEYAGKNFGVATAPTVRSLNELGVLDTANSLTTLDGTIQRKGYDLQARGQFRELQFRLASTAGKISARRLSATAFEDSMVLQS